MLILILIGNSVIFVAENLGTRYIPGQNVTLVGAYTNIFVPFSMWYRSPMELSLFPKD